MKYRNILLLSSITTLLLTGCGTKVEQTADSLTLELGDTLTLSAEDFFTADKPEALDEIFFDTASVDIRKTGTYPVTAAYQKERYTINVQIQDTTAPDIVLKEELPDINMYDSINAADFVDVTDSSSYTVY